MDRSEKGCCAVLCGQTLILVGDGREDCGGVRYGDLDQHMYVVQPGRSIEWGVKAGSTSACLHGSGGSFR